VLPVIQAEAEKSGVEVRLECADDLAVHGDAALLEQAFLNLGLNACQAMPSGGRLRIAAAAPSSERLEIAIEDTGMGIAPEHLARIFDLYFTTKEHGAASACRSCIARCNSTTARFRWSRRSAAAPRSATLPRA
jgi:signal transduction histidine kinase